MPSDSNKSGMTRHPETKETRKKNWQKSYQFKSNLTLKKICKINYVNQILESKEKEFSVAVEVEFKTKCEHQNLLQIKR